MKGYSIMDRVPRGQRKAQLLAILAERAGGPDQAAPISDIAKWIGLGKNIYLRTLLNELAQAGHVGVIPYTFANGAPGYLYHYQAQETAGRGRGR